MKKKKTTIPRHLKKIFVSFLTMLLVFNTLNLPVVQAEDNYVMLNGEFGDGRNDKDALDYDRATIDKKVSFGNKPGEYFIDLSIKGKDLRTVETTDIVLVYDNSNSMKTAMGTGTRATVSKEATTDFINELFSIQGHKINVALVTYGSSIFDGVMNQTWASNPGVTANHSHKVLTNDADSITTKLPTYVPSDAGHTGDTYHGGTFTQMALREAGNILSSSNADNKIIITITDGAPTLSYVNASGNNASNNINGNGTSFKLGNGNHGTPTIQTAQTLMNDYLLYTVGIGLGQGDSGTGASVTDVKDVINGITTGKLSPEKDLKDNAYMADTVSELTAALWDIANKISNSVVNGSVEDPMGEYFNLKGADNFTPATNEDLIDGNYYLFGNKQGLTNGVTVNNDGNTIKLDKLNLGAGDQITLRYKVQIDTDKEGFETDKLYRTNGLTTLIPDPNSPNEKNIFPEPYASAKPVTVEGIKIWDDLGNEDKRPDYITVDLVRNDAVIATKDVKPNEDGNWEYTFENQVWYDSEGNKIEYKVREHLLPGYHTSYDEGQIINKFKEPKISLIKEADKEELVVGETITYTFTSVNTGNVTLENIRLIDELEGMSVISFDTLNENPIDNIQDVKFEPGDTIVATATYEVTQEDFDRGNVLNYAEITGTPVREIEGETFEDVSDDDVARVPGIQEPAINLIKKNEILDGNTISEVGQVVRYKFVISNIGNVTLTNITLEDEMLDQEALNAELANVELGPSDSITIYQDYTVTQEDLDKGHILNHATVEGTPPGNEPGDPNNPSDEDEVDVPTENNPAIQLEKDADKDGLTVGETITYTFTVTNTGNVTLKDINLTDELNGLSDIQFKTLNGETIDSIEGLLFRPDDVLVANATYTVLQTDVNKGFVYNKAHVEGTSVVTKEGEDPKKVTDIDDVEITEEMSADIKLDKLADKKLVSEVDEEIEYTFIVKNTGNVTLTNVKVYDDMLDIEVTLNTTTLQPGEEAVGTAKYTVKQSDINNGRIYNYATTEGTPPGHDPDDPSTPQKPTDDADVEVKTDNHAAIELEKVSDKELVTKAGEKLIYTFTVKNTGKVTLTDVSVEDDMLSKLGLVVELDNTTLEPGEIATGSVEYEVTQDDIDNGFVYNHATAEGTPPNYDPEDPDSEKPTDDDEVTVDVELNPSIKLEKVADKELVTEVGEEIVYTFKITNNGNTTLTDIYVRDDMLDNLELPVFLDKTTLAPGESTTAVVEGYKATQEDFDHGLIPNLAYVYGTPPSGDDDKVSDNDWVSVLTDSEANIQLDKVADKEEITEAGEIVTYTFTVTNTGKVTLSDITVEDKMLDELGINVELEKTTLAPGESTSVSVEYEVTQEDIDNGKVTNYAVAEGTPPKYDPEDPESKKPTDDDEVEVPSKQSPSMTLEKTSDKEEVSEAGETITYTFTVTNTGNVTLSHVSVDDEMLREHGIDVVLSKTTLAPGESISVSVEYEVTQDDIDHGVVRNVATVEGTPPGNEPGDPDNPGDEDEVDVPSENNPAIHLDKLADKDGLTVGETITYTFTITNTGNVTLKDINLTDELTGLSDIQYKTLNGITIESVEGLLFHPDDVLVANATYLVSQTDVNNGFVHNEAHVEGTSVVIKESEEPKKVTDTDDVKITEEISADIELEKVSDKELVTKAGEKLTYTFTVKNTGNVTLTEVSVKDDMLSKQGLEVELDKTTLNPGEIATGSVEYEVTQDDIDNGIVYNHATAEGTPPNYDPENPDSEKPTDEDEVTVDVELNPSIKLEKVADKEIVTEVGEEIVYTFTITNNGNTTLTNVNVRDDMLDNLELPVVLDKTTLAPGESTTAVVAGYKSTQEDFDYGLIPNLAYAYGTPPSGEDDEVFDTDRVSVLTDSEANIQLDKVADKKEITEAGEIVTYTFTVTNTGKVTLSDVTVEDEMLDELGINVELEKTTLAPGESTSVSVEYEVTQEDIDNGKVTNYAVAEGTPPKYDPEDPDSKKPIDDDEVEVPSKQSPSMKLEKTSDKKEVSEAGETITYTFTVTNTGNVTLSHVSIDDEMLREHGIDVVLSKTTLAPGENVSVSVEYEVTQDDIDHGVVRNVATVEGTPPGNEPGDPDNPGDEDEVDVPTENNPAIHLEKVSDKKKVVNAGEFITYTFTVTNTGNVTLTGVEVEDDMLKDLGIEVILEKTTLAPGETVKTSVKYEVTQDDIDNGFVYNHATAEGTPPNYDPEDPDSEKPTDEDDVEVPSEKNASMTLEKLSDKEIVATVGDEIIYTFVVRNTGNVTLNGVKVNDKMLEDLGIKVLLDKDTLLPGESATGKAVYVITQDDVDRGYVYNHATTEGIPPGHTPDDPKNPVDEDDVTVPTVEDPSIKLKKNSNKDLVTKVGEIVEYTFEITNTGNITLRNITLEDIMLGGIIPLDVNTLKPGETYMITVDYKVKSSDLKQKNIVNTAKVLGETENGVEVFDFGEDIINVAITEASRLPLTGAPNLLLISFALLVTSGILLLISLRKRNFN